MSENKGRSVRPKISKCVRCGNHWIISDNGRATDVPSWSEALRVANRRVLVAAQAAQRRMALAA
jgi:hypothetical protein